MPQAAATGKRTFSLRAHLLLLVIGTTVPVLAVAAFLGRRVVADNRDAVERRLLEAARAEAAVVDAELGGSIRALQGLAESDRLTNGEVPGFDAEARRLLGTQPTWSAVSLSTVDGRQIVNTTRPLGEPLPLVSDRESFDRAVRTRAPAIGALRRGQITNQLGFLIRVPAVRSGRVVYVISTWITSHNFSGVLGRQASLSEEWVRGVVDPAGVIAARSRDADRFVGREATSSTLALYRRTDEGFFRDRALDGTPVYGAFSRAPMSRWIAGVAVPVAVVDVPFRQSMMAFGALAIVLFAVGGGGTYVISRRNARDISQSAAVAEAIAAGERPSWPSSRITEVQRLLDALGRAAALLEVRERERDEHVRRADEARARAEAADHAKDQFLAMLGHELRNPLAPALTALHLMKLRGDGGSRERDVLERQIQHMARLVDDLLDVSRLQRGAIELRRERFDIRDAIARAVEMTAPLYEGNKHTLRTEIDGGLVIEGDRVRLAQVLSNLLSNAAKYTTEGGRVELVARREDGQVVVECRDNGIGIPSDLLPHVFDLFVQGQRGLDRRQGGLGLGLAVARTLVELHGGTLSATSGGPDRGSTFTLRLQAADPPGAAAPAGGADMPRADGNGRRIGRVLIVDDNQDALDLLLEALEDAGVEAYGAATPAEALDVAARVKPQVAVLDIGLPGMNGFELGRELQSRAADAPPRLIALTGYGREQDMAAARAAGFEAFFVKPADLDRLVDALGEPADAEAG
jgi:signal transduction histidine kinase